MRRFTRILFLCILLLPVFVISAQTSEDTITGFPTLTTLNETIVPPSDVVDLARRLADVTEITLPPPTTDLPTGTRDRFNVTNSSAETTFEVDATLQAVGQHIYIWVEDGITLTDKELSALTSGFDNRVYHQTRELWGSEPIPGVDGDPRVHALFARGLGAFTGAYFARKHTFPAAVFPSSNEHEMFIVNYEAYAGDIAGQIVESTLAHEFQHMIRNHVDPNEDTWLNEGFSTFTELYLGYDTSYGIAASFLFSPGTQLNTFGLGGTNRAANYGAGFLFMSYFYDRYGIDAVQMLSEDPANGLTSVDHVLNALGEPDVNTFFADWVLANLMNDSAISDGRYGYGLLRGTTTAAMRGSFDAYPASVTANVAQYATHYYELTNLSAFDTLNIALTMPQTVTLVPAELHSGDRVWYSNRADVSNPRLTRAFDLTAVESATLNYQTWYDIEEGWDYVYVSISADEGVTWDILTAPAMTTLNPHGNAYGPGYSGLSDGWLAQSISLDAYAGEDVLLRFELVTDDAVNQPGLLLDDLSIPEIGYSSDFDTGDGGWVSEGWLLMDNLLPQQVWLQAVQYSADGVEITRWQAADSLEWSLPLVRGVQRVVIAVSPFAPLTTVDMPYSLTITGN